MWRIDEKGKNLANAVQAYHRLRSRARKLIEQGDKRGVNLRLHRVRLRDKADNVLFEGSMEEAAHLQFGSDTRVVPKPTGRYTQEKTRRGAVRNPVSIQLAEINANTLQVTRDSLHAAISAGSDVVYRMSADWSEMHHLTGNGFIQDMRQPNPNWLETYIPPEDRLPVRSVIDEAIRGRTVFNLTHRVIKVDGSIGWTRSCALPVVGQNGEVREWIGSADDLTARVALDDGVAKPPAVPRWDAATLTPACKDVVQRAIDDWTSFQQDPLTLSEAERTLGNMALLIARRLVQAGLINSET